jgi:predicted GNAT superfamily acetyltransferase
MAKPRAEEVTYRHLTAAADYEQCVELQRSTWGESFNELVPPAILKISQKVGGVAAGAFDHDGRLLGFVFGISGVRGGRAAHWSHMLAVVPEARGLGLGKGLKVFQRRELVRLGIEMMYWTFDPLVARNANLNLNRLGARPQEYVRDMYGSDTGSDVHSGLGTDRFIVAWELAGDEVEARLRAADETASGEHGRTVEEVAEERVLNRTGRRDDRLAPGTAGWGGDSPPVLYAEVPWDIDAEKRRSMDVARAWRRSSRAALEGALAAGYRVAGFVFAPQAEPVRCYYRLERGEGL